jgi:conjugative relaxase-like TrwC/TraI family protein
VLTFRKGTGGAPTAAAAMAEHLREQTLSAGMATVAEYYLRGVKHTAAGTAAIPRQDMSFAVAEALGLDVNRAATHEEVVNLLQGRRADGREIAGKPRYEVAAGKDRITYVDFTFSAPKSVSVAMALAPTDAERYMIVGAHRDAWMAAMGHLETIVAHARKGKAGSKGSVRGDLGWVSFDHYTARPTIEIPHTEADGTRTTLIQTVKVAGDMQLHTHVTTPNAVVCADGSVGSIDMLALHDRVHEVGAYYQAHLATRLRAQGIDVVLDPRTESARIPAVPDAVCEVFSKRVRDGEAAAREYVAAQGLDWDAMHPMELFGVLKGGTRATRRQKETGRRGDDLSDEAAWKAQAKAAGYEHRTVVDRDTRNRLPAPEQDRLRRAYHASLPVLERQLERRAVLSANVARTAAARGLIAAGAESAADIDKLTAAMREYGVRHAGRQVPLIWAKVDADSEAAAPSGRRPQVKLTTALHVEQEEAAMALARAAAADGRGALTPERIKQAVRRVSERDGLDFSQGHGLEQRRVIDALGTAGRFAVAVGAAGAGKTTLLRPLVDAWSQPGPDGVARRVYGTALAWRQSDPLADAGIPRENTMAIAALLTRAGAGKLALDRDSVVVVDELSQVGTAQALALLRLQERLGFSIVAIGDDRQGQAIEAGSTVRMLRRALGIGAVPELDTTVRQLRARDRVTARLFREGKAAEGIVRLREDGHALLVSGGRRQAIAAAADLWEARRSANAGRLDYSLTVSVPTNTDARDLGAAIRERRRAVGHLGRDEVTIQATDQNGAEFALPLAVGDRVRLFARTPAAFGGKGGNLGNNGSVVEIERIETEGLRLRNAKGSSGFVKWDTLRDPASGRVRLTYGDAVTIDAIQSATSTEHLNVLPNGSEAVHGFKNYVAQSRSRETTWLVVADGRERVEIMGKRALGNVDPITADDVWRNVAANLSRQPEKELAIDLLRRSREVHTGTVRSLAAAFQPRQQRRAEGQEETTLHQTFSERRDEQHVARAAENLAAAIAPRAIAFRKVAGLLTGPADSETRAAVHGSTRAARRSVRGLAERPKRERRVSPMAQAKAEVEVEFAEALRGAGLRPRDAPIMDGRKHRVPVEGDRPGRRSGTYIGHFDEHPAGYIHNFKTGEEIRWKASRAWPALSRAERHRELARIEEARAAREAARRRREEAVADLAVRAWNRARPVETHPYLTRKGLAAHGLRQNRSGHLLVPMRDAAGRLWGVQSIDAAGTKRFMGGGRKHGLYAALDAPEPGEPVVIAEGYATAAALREATGLATIAAFDGGNLLDVARAVREREPARRVVIAADNDHHLPRRAIPLPNVGLEKATAAAEAVGGVVLSPAFTPGDKGTDWNDYAAQHGRQALRVAAQTALRAHGMALPSGPRAAPTHPAALTRAARTDQTAVVGPAPTQADRDVARQRLQGGPGAGAAEAAAREAARQAQRERAPRATP